MTWTDFGSFALLGVAVVVNTFTSRALRQRIERLESQQRHTLELFEIEIEGRAIGYKCQHGVPICVSCPRDGSLRPVYPGDAVIRSQKGERGPY